MALNLKIADLYADLKINTAQFDAQLARVKAQLASIQVAPVMLQMNTAAAMAGLNAILAKLQQIHAAAGVNVRGAGGAGGAGGMGGSILKGFAVSKGIGAINATIDGVTEGIKASVQTAIDLEAKFAEVRRVAGLSADETERLKRELMAISTVQPGVALDDLIKMADIGGRMGLKGGELKEFASGLAMVKNSVSGMDTESLANNMSRTLHVFNLGTEYVKGFGSALTAMDNATTAIASDILKITQGLSGTAAAIGLTLPQVIALSASLRDVGLTNAVASSSMSQVFRKMATNMDEFANAAGVDAGEFAAAYRRGPMEALSMLMKKLHETKDTIQTQELLKSLGLEGVRTGGALLQLAQTFDKLGPMTAAANAEFTSLKSLLDAGAIKGDTTAASIGKLENATKGAADSLGSLFTPAIKAVSDEMTEAITRGNTLLGIFQQFQNQPGQLGGMQMQMAGIFGKGILRNVLNGGAFIPQIPAIGAGGGGPALPKPAALAGNAGAGGAGAGAAGAGGGAGAKPWGLGPIADAIGKRLGVAGAVAGQAGGAMQQLGQQLAKSLGPKDRPGAAVGLSGQDFGKMQQQQILDSSAKDTAKNTATTAEVLTQMWQLMMRAKGNATNALLGP